MTTTPPSALTEATSENCSSTDCSFCCRTETAQNKHHLGPRARICSQCILDIVERAFFPFSFVDGDVVLKIEGDVVPALHSPKEKP